MVDDFAFGISELVTLAPGFARVALPAAARDKHALKFYRYMHI